MKSPSIWQSFTDDYPEFLIQRESEYTDALNNYKKTFGHLPPTAKIPKSFSNKEIINAINTCIMKKEDALLKELGIELDSRFVY